MRRLSGLASRAAADPTTLELPEMAHRWARARPEPKTSWWPRLVRPRRVARRCEHGETSRRQPRGNGGQASTSCVAAMRRGRSDRAISDPSIPWPRYWASHLRTGSTGSRGGGVGCVGLTRRRGRNDRALSARRARPCARASPSSCRRSPWVRLTETGEAITSPLLSGHPLAPMAACGPRAPDHRSAVLKGPAGRRGRAVARTPGCAWSGCRRTAPRWLLWLTCRRRRGWRPTPGWHPGQRSRRHR